MDYKKELNDIFRIMSSGILKYDSNHNLEKSTADIISIGQIHYLSAIKGDKCKISDVSKRLGVSKASGSIAINKLIDCGYVRKIISDKDKRVYYVSLTEEGEQISKIKEEVFVSYSNHIIDLLDEDELKTLVGILKKVVK